MSLIGCRLAAESEMFRPMLRGQRKTYVNANWNLFVRFCGERRTINPANINQINNIRLETVICFHAIIVLVVPYCVYIYFQRIRITTKGPHVIPIRIRYGP